MLGALLLSMILLSLAGKKRFSMVLALDLDSARLSWLSVSDSASMVCLGSLIFWRTFWRRSASVEAGFCEEGMILLMVILELEFLDVAVVTTTFGVLGCCWSLLFVPVGGVLVVVYFGLREEKKEMNNYYVSINVNLTLLQILKFKFLICKFKLIYVLLVPSYIYNLDDKFTMH